MKLTASPLCCDSEFDGLADTKRSPLSMRDAVNAQCANGKEDKAQSGRALANANGKISRCVQCKIAARPPFFVNFGAIENEFGKVSVSLSLTSDGASR